jgi:hypothetical protein
MRKIGAGLGVLACVFLVAPATASSDVQGWLIAAGDVRIADDTAITADVVLRSRPDRAELGQAIYRVGVRQRIAPDWTVQLTYGLVETPVEGGPDVFEHRLGQNLSHQFAPIGRTRIDGRIGLEQRFPDAGGAVGWRVRGRARAVQPLGGGIDLNLSEELIGALNTTAWGQRSGLSASRTGAGLRFPVTPRFGIGPSYTWQHIFLAGRDDRNDHVLAVTLDAHF